MCTLIKQSCYVCSRLVQTGFIPISDLEDSSKPSSPAPFIFITDYNTSPWSDVSEEYAIHDQDFVVSKIQITVRKSKYNNYFKILLLRKARVNDPTK